MKFSILPPGFLEVMVKPLQTLATLALKRVLVRQSKRQFLVANVESVFS